MKVDDVFSLSTPFFGTYRLKRLRFGEGSPHFVVVAGLHGNELNGIHTLNLLASSLRNQRPRGTVDLFPVVNTFGVDEGRKRGPFLDEDLNTAFPGDPDGTAAQRIAHALLEVTHGDVCVDVHSGSPMVHEMPQVRASLSGPEVEFARLSGLPFIWRRQVLLPDANGLVGGWRARGRVAMRVMGGRGASLDKPEALAMADGLRQIMVSMGIVSGGTTSKTVADVTHDEVTSHRSGTGGFFVPEVHVGDRVGKGYLLGRVVAPVGGETLEEVRSDRDGVVVTVRVYPMVHASELLARIAAVGH